MKPNKRVKNSYVHGKFSSTWEVPSFMSLLFCATLEPFLCIHSAILFSHSAASPRHPHLLLFTFIGAHFRHSLYLQRFRVRHGLSCVNGPFGLARAGCYSQAALSLPHSKPLYAGHTLNISAHLSNAGWIDTHLSSASSS